MTEREYEELYRKEERLGHLICSDAAPTRDQLAMARADVERFEREMRIQEQENLE